MIKTCTQCGAINGAEARTCCLCDTRLSQNADDIAVATPAEPKSGKTLSVAQDWRSEVFERVEAYHTRRGRPRVERAEPELGFTEPISPQSSSVEPEKPGFEAAPAAIATRRFHPARTERMEIEVEQPSFDFIRKTIQADSKRALSPYDSPVPLVAPLAERRRAGALDLAFLFFAYAGFLMLFRALGGQFGFSRFDLLITGATFGLLYAQYVALFTYFGQATPGMILRGLRVASLDGLEASPRQLLWRSLGYLISAGTMMLGFLWILWDEDQLSWHDRISQTYITSGPAPLAAPYGQPNATR